MNAWIARAAALVTLASLAALAQEYPGRPLRLIVADGPGSVGDARARTIAAKMAEGLGQPVVVENKPGANMVIAAEAAARAAPDGYTMFMGNTLTHAINPWTFKTLPYRPDDFVPVSLVAAGPMILAVHADVPAKTLDELLQLGRAQPGKLAYGTIGFGSPGHLVMEQISAGSGARFHLVPYKSMGQYVQDLVGGHLQLALNYWVALGPHVKSGKLRAIAVIGPKRLPVAPDLPTLEELGVKGVDSQGWQGIMVPAGTPKPVVARLQSELARVIALPEIRAGIVDTGAELGGNSPEEFAAFIRADRERWRKAVANAGLEPM